MDLAPPPSLRFVLEVAADSGARFVPLAGATADANAAADGRLALLVGARADADAAANRLCAFARAFFASRAASAARCFSSAASAACCFAVAALASDAAAPNISLSNADLAAGSPESSNSNVGHSN